MRRRAAGVDPDAVAAVCGRDRVVTVPGQRLPQLGDVDVDGLLGRRRRRLAPELVDQALARDELVRMQEQDRQDEPLFQPAQRERTRPPSTTSSGPRIRYSTSTFYRFRSQNGSSRRPVRRPALCPLGAARLTPRCTLAGHGPRASPSAPKPVRLPRRGLDGRARLRDRQSPAEGRQTGGSLVHQRHRQQEEG